MGVLEGKISPSNMHDGSLFNGTNWILPFDKDKAFTWKVGDKVKFKIDKTDWKNQSKKMRDLISLRVNEEGLGPASWWMNK